MPASRLAAARAMLLRRYAPCLLPPCYADAAAAMALSALVARDRRASDAAAATRCHMPTMLLAFSPRARR